MVDEGGSPVTPSTAFVVKLLAIGNWLYNQHVSGNVPTNANKEAFINSIIAEHNGISDVEIGQIVNGITTSRNLIDYISLSLSDNDKKYNIKIWCSDSKFREQYEDFIIYTIPPIGVIDDLHTKFITKVANHYQTAQLTPVVVKENPLEEPLTSNILNFKKENKPNKEETSGKSGVFTLICITIIICLIGYYFGL